MRQQEGYLMGDKETRWWNDEVKDAIRAKKRSTARKWDAPGRQRQLPPSKQGGKERSSKTNSAGNGLGVPATFL